MLLTANLFPKYLKKKKFIGRKHMKKMLFYWF